MLLPTVVTNEVNIIGCTSINGGTMHSEPGLGHAGLG